MKIFRTITVITILILTGCASASPGVTPESTTSLAESAEEIAPAETLPVTESSDSIEVTGGDESALREFIHLWFAPVYPTDSAQKPMVYIKSLPQGIPHNLPIPDGARIIGSVTGYPVEYSIILSANQDSKAVQKFYERVLVEDGWRKAPAQGGFGYEADLFSGYCYDDNSAFLQVETPALSKTETMIRLSLDIQPEAYQCDSGPYIGPIYMSLIPILHAPNGVAVTGSGSGGGIDTDGYTTMTLQGNISEIEVMENYNQQLAAAGWEMKNNGSEDGTAWSNWTFRDETGAGWAGSLIVVKSIPESGSLFVLLRVEKSVQ